MSLFFKLFSNICQFDDPDGDPMARSSAPLPDLLPARRVRGKTTTVDLASGLAYFLELLMVFGVMEVELEC